MGGVCETGEERAGREDSKVAGTEKNCTTLYNVLHRLYYIEMEKTGGRDGRLKV